MTADTAMRHGSYDRPTLRFCKVIAMERFLLLWDELDDLVGTSRYYVKNTAMAIWTSRPPALIDPLILGPCRGLEF